MRHEDALGGEDILDRGKARLCAADMPPAGRRRGVGTPRGGAITILGGLDSIPGAIVGGLIVGIVENVAAGYIDPYVGGGTKDFAPYVLMIAALMVRPYGIFGRAEVRRV